jgi:AraC family transcriptional regulator, ethanolamine operon transcriptional activator
MVAQPITDECPWAFTGTFHDIDAQAAQYAGYDQQYQQLSHGRFEGKFRNFRLGDDLIIGLESANRELACSAATPAGRYGACFLAKPSPPCTLNGLDFSQDSVALTPQGKTLEGRTPEGLRVYCLDISATLFPEYGGVIRMGRILSDPVRCGELREWVQSALATFTYLKSPNDYPAALRAFKSSLADLLWEISGPAENRNAIKTPRNATSRTVRVFRRAREYIHCGLSDGISIDVLCRSTGVSRRSLEYAFRSVVGIAPARYIRLLQLNRIHRELTSEANQEVSIGVIAARNGVWHWSRFSRDYRMLFGELPSQTRHRRE